jgi:8-oxo-dGTP pyrophosphatase MutT (NUDIX family)
VRDGDLLVFEHRDFPEAGTQVPAGTVDRGEAPARTVVREVLEETGVRGRIVVELEPTSYVDRKGRDKLVRWYRMALDGDPVEFAPNDEVDELRWLTPGEAGALLSYERDRALVQALA